MAAMRMELLYKRNNGDVVRCEQLYSPIEFGAPRTFAGLQFVVTFVQCSQRGNDSPEHYIELTELNDRDSK